MRVVALGNHDIIPLRRLLALDSRRCYLVDLTADLIYYYRLDANDGAPWQKAQMALVSAVGGRVGAAADGRDQWLPCDA